MKERSTQCSLTPGQLSSVMEGTLAPRTPFPTLALTFAASGPRGRSAAGSPAHTAPSATHGRTGTAPRSRPWHSLWGKQTRSHLHRSDEDWRKQGGQPLPPPVIIQSHQDFLSLTLFYMEPVELRGTLGVS